MGVEVGRVQVLVEESETPETVCKAQIVVLNPYRYAKMVVPIQRKNLANLRK